MATGYIVAFGDEGTDLNGIGTTVYGVVDGTGIILADGTNNAELVDVAAFFPDTEAGKRAAKELEATKQAQDPDRYYTILTVNRTTTITDPTGLAVGVEPV